MVRNKVRFLDWDGLGRNGSQDCRIIGLERNGVGRTRVVHNNRCLARDNMARGHHLKRSRAFWFFLVFSFLQLAVIINSSQRYISCSFSSCTSPEERRYRKSWTAVFVKPLNTNGRHYRLFHAPGGRRFFST